jgi:hypothetical protein
MTDLAVFVDSFDQVPPVWCGAKYTRVVGDAGAYTLVPGPYHGDAARFGGTDNWLGPALMSATDPAGAGDNPYWDAGSFSANVRLGTEGWSGEVCFLAPCFYDGTDAFGILDFPHHWLTVDEGGTVRVVSWRPQPFDYPTIRTLAESAPGAFPLGVWVGVEYRTLIRGDAPPAPEGVCELRLDETLVLVGEGLETVDPQRASTRARYFRFGNIGTLAVNDDEYPLYANAVAVDVDDVCQRCDSAFGGPAPAWRGTHRVALRLPSGPGDAAGLTVVGQPAGENWRACADLPADDTPPVGEADDSYVEKPAGTTPPHPYDLYAIEDFPAFEEGEAGAAAFHWGIVRYSEPGTAPEPGPAVSTVLAWKAPDGVVQGRFLNITGVYEGYGANAVTNDVTGLTNHDLAGMQIGFGSPFEWMASPEQTYWATQRALELWYRPWEPPPPPGAARTWVVWWP